RRAQPRRGPRRRGRRHREGHHGRRPHGLPAVDHAPREPAVHRGLQRGLRVRRGVRRRRRRTAARPLRGHHPCPRRADRRAGAGVHGARPRLQPRVPHPPAARRRPGRGPAAGRAVRPGLDPVYRADAGGRAVPGLHGGQRRTGGAAVAELLPGPGTAVRPGLPALPPGTGRLRLGQAPLPARHRRGRRDAGRGGAAPGHRSVDRCHRRHAGLDRELHNGDLAVTSSRPSTVTEPPRTEPSAPALSPLGWARWAWRVLTSMRTALVLLFLLALGAIPGSLLPQRAVSVEQVQNYYLENPDLAPLLDQLFLFDVYASPWYSAIYLLLFISLAGCVLPRAAAHYRLMRARPPRTPRRLDRMPYSATLEVDAAPEQVLAEARELLKGHRIADHGDSLSAETGYLRETGNVVFHLSLLGLLVSLACGSFFGYRGNMLLVEGDAFANTLTSYDAFHPGTAVDPAAIQPFWMRLDDFEASFVEEGGMTGQAESYRADVTYRESPEEPERTHVLAVNHPLRVDGAQVYLLGHGYAPTFRVTDADGQVVFDQAVPFLDRGDGNFTSDGVVKVPDIAPEQLGFTGVF